MDASGRPRQGRGAGCGDERAQQSEQGGVTARMVAPHPGGGAQGTSSEWPARAGGSSVAAVSGGRAVAQGGSSGARTEPRRFCCAESAGGRSRLAGQNLMPDSRPRTRFIFVTGGVVSSLGKGIAAASIGRLLVSRGLKVALQKFDPYINVDPGR